jgi:hypothetical protein
MRHDISPGDLTIAQRGPPHHPDRQCVGQPQKTSPLHTQRDCLEIGQLAEMLRFQRAIRLGVISATSTALWALPTIMEA